jgi:hypothetical protein
MAKKDAPRTLQAAVNQLVERYRDVCLWFLRADYYPQTPEQMERTLRYIQRHGNMQAFQEAAELLQWLSRNSSEASAGS